MNHGPFAFTCAGLALVGVPGCLAQAARSDFEWLLRAQAGLSSLPPEQLAKKEMECRETTIQRVRFLRRKTFISLAWVFSALVAAVAFLSLPEMSIPKFTLQHAFGAVSVCSLSWGTLGRLGWREGSYKGGTVHEELDTLIFWFLYWLGTMFGIAALVGTAA